MRCTGPDQSSVRVVRGSIFDRRFRCLSVYTARYTTEIDSPVNRLAIDDFRCSLSDALYTVILFFPVPIISVICSFRMPAVKSSLSAPPTGFKLASRLHQHKTRVVERGDQVEDSTSSGPPLYFSHQAKALLRHRGSAIGKEGGPSCSFCLSPTSSWRLVSFHNFVLHQASPPDLLTGAETSRTKPARALACLQLSTTLPTRALAFHQFPAFHSNSAAGAAGRSDLRGPSFHQFRSI